MNGSTSTCACGNVSQKKVKQQTSVRVAGRDAMRPGAGHWGIQRKMHVMAFDRIDRMVEVVERDEVRFGESRQSRFLDRFAPRAAA